MMTPAGAEGVPDGMRELIGPAQSMRCVRTRSPAPSRTPIRQAMLDAALAAAGIDRQRPRCGGRSSTCVRGRHAAAARAQLYAVPVLGDLASGARARLQGLVGDTYSAGGETVTQAFIRILTALGRLADHVRAYRLRYRACAYRRHRSRRRGAPGLARGRPPDRRLLPAGPPCVDPALVDRRGLTPRYPRALPGLARAPPARYSRGAQAARVRRVPPHRRCARGARPGRARCARGPQAQGASFPGLAAAGGFRRRADRACQPVLDPRRGRQGPRDRGAVRDIRT